jgi:ATP-dependent NAD(P)H-hydrate dehydratase
VHPLLPEGGLGAASASEAVLSATAACTDWLSRLNALCIGPGLGRDEAALAVAEALLTAALERQLPCVLDGDGLWLVTRKPQLLSGQAAGRCILTPNVNEFSRLTSALGIHTGGADAEGALSALSAALGVRVDAQAFPFLA